MVYYGTLGHPESLTLDAGLDITLDVSLCCNLHCWRFVAPLVPTLVIQVVNLPSTSYLCINLYIYCAWEAQQICRARPAVLGGGCPWAQEARTYSYHLAYFNLPSSDDLYSVSQT